MAKKAQKVILPSETTCPWLKTDTPFSGIFDEAKHSDDGKLVKELRAQAAAKEKRGKK